MKTKQFILLGPPGVAVQEHAAALAERWQVPHVSMPASLQVAIAPTTALGLAVRPYLETGASVPDEWVLKWVRQRFEQPDTVLQGWVLDGFPRTLGQAQGFDEWWSKFGKPAATVIYFEAMTGILLNRLVSQPGQTESAPAIRRRLERYQAEVEPLLEYYRERQQLVTLNASLSFAEVARELTGLGQDNAGAAPLIRDEAELDALITRQPRLVVDCMASWCGSCKQVSPFIDKLAETYRDRVKVVKIDFDTNRQISKRFGLQGIPAVMFFKDGQLLEILTGVKAYQEYNATVSNLLD